MHRKVGRLPRISWLILIIAILYPAFGGEVKVGTATTENTNGFESINSPPRLETVLTYQIKLPLIINEFPPTPTTSWYMESGEPQYLYDMGCAMGTADRGRSSNLNRVVILAFGRPTYVNGNFGAGIFDGGAIAATDIAILVELYGAGYHDCVSPFQTPRLTIAIGTNNCDRVICPDAILDSLYFDHGSAWAAMVNQVGSYFVSNGFYPQVRAYGASDMEVDWNDYFATRTWVDGYSSNNAWPLINFGDAQGCPEIRTHSNALCDNDWYQYTIWYISGRGGLNPSMPLPLIYATNGANARQWYSLSAYAYDLQGGRLRIQGAISQEQACKQKPCSPLVKNSPRTASFQLYSALASDTVTFQYFNWSTDFSYSGLP